jgi:branched-chain amino acid transport system permease protein
MTIAHPDAAARAPARKQSTTWLGDLALIAIAVTVYFVFPYDLGLCTRIVILMIFVLSLDLILGYAGVATLGHAAMYGTGAYAAGLFSIHVYADPTLGLLVGAMAGATIAFVSGLLLMRAHGLTVLMLSIAVAQVLQEVANKARPITGGADGLSGITMKPVLGLFEFDFVGKTGYWYAVTVLILVLMFLRIVVRSPFGLAARGIHESHARMRSIGTSVYWRLVALYTLAGAIAGIAGSLSAQITAVVGLDSYNFSLSAEAVIMLVLGGAGRLYGAMIGTTIFMVVHHIASSINPTNWLFIIGFLVVVVVFFVPGGLMSIGSIIRQRLGGRL